jgi:hypothetical protein
MTTYTRIPEGEQASISINPQHTISRISKYTYGGFTEYVSLPSCPSASARVAYPKTHALTTLVT